MKTTIALLALFVFVLGGGYLAYSNAHPMPQNSADTAQVADTSSAVSATTTSNSGSGSTGSGSTSGAAAPGTYTSAQVAMHNTSSSCWTIISGNVYDLTQWIFQHPGGEGAILSICGQDGTQAFQAQHGRPRDTQPQQILVSFKIGTLAS